MGSCSWNGIQIKNNNKDQLQEGVGSGPMKNHTNTEFQAVMNLLYICDDDEPSSLHHTYPKKELGVLKDHQNKIKSNTIHLRTTKKQFSNHNLRTQSLEHSRDYSKLPSENKENLKKILKKLQSSPSPPAKRKEAHRPKQIYRIDTQKSEPNSSSNLNRMDAQSHHVTKQSLDKLFDRKKDKSFIKSLIKAKIVQKLKKVDSKNTSKKVSTLGCKMQTLVQFSNNKLREGRPSVLKANKGRQLKSNFMHLLREEKKMNNPVLRSTSTKMTVKQLLM